MLPPEAKPIHLTLRRHDDLISVDMADTGTLIPRTETRVDDAFLREIGVEMEHIARQGVGMERALAGLGGLVFSHLLTDNVRRRLCESSATDLYLRLDERLVHVPWELAHDGENFLLSRFRIGRQIITTRAIPDHGALPSRRDHLRLLLVADPTGDLPQASAAAEELCSVLDQAPGVAVTLLSGSGVRRIPLLAALQEHDVVHFAGHSHYDPVTPARSGWQLGDGILLASDVAKLRSPPLLVFANSCAAAAPADGGASFERHAFGIGSAFLLAGVPNYVGTFWVAHDAESIAFATAYARALAGGDCLGDALQRAQQGAIARHGSDGLGWASYFLYGDPALRPLQPSSGAAQASSTAQASGAPQASAAPSVRRAGYRDQVRFEVSLGGDRDQPTPKIDRVAEPSNVVGRDEELSRLAAALAAARDGHRATVFVSGPPGIGKTTLLDAFLERVGAAGDVWIAQGQAIEQYGAGEAYLPLLEALGRLGRNAEGHRLVGYLRRYAPTWLAELPTLLDPDEHEAIVRRSQGSTRDRMLRELAELLEALTIGERPLVLVLEDLHWSDRATIDAIAYLAQRPTHARLLLAVTYRPAEVMDREHPLRSLTQELKTRGRSVEVDLDALQTVHVEQMLRDRFDADGVDEDLVRSLYQRTEGHPLFVTNVIDLARREGLITVEGGRLRLRGGPETLASAIPAGLRSLIERQIEALAADDQHLLESAAVAGAEFSAATVAAALDGKADDVDDRFSGLAWRGQFLRAAGLEEWPDGTLAGRYRFVHALYQNLFYERIPEQRRIRLHRRIGERRAAAFGTHADEIAGELASHFAGARDLRRAAEYQTRAGDVAVRRHADREAVEHFRKALGFVSDLGSHAERSQIELDVLVRLATPLMSTAGYAAREVETVFDRARTLARQLPPGPHVAPLLRGLASFYQVRARNRDALAVGEELLAFCATADDPIALVQAHYGHGVTLYSLVELDAALRHIVEVCERYDPATHPTHVAVYGGYDPGVASLCWRGFIHWLRVEPEDSIRWCEQGLDLAERLGHRFTVTFAEMSLAMLHLFQDDVLHALPRIEHAAQIAREDGFSYHLAVLTGLEAWSRLLQGRPAQAIELGEECVRRLHETGAVSFLPAFTTVFAMAKAFVGRVPEAVADVDAAIADAERTEQLRDLGQLYRSRATLCLMSGDGPEQHAEAEALHRRAHDLARRLGAPMLELGAATGLAGFLIRRGRADEARAVLQPVCDALATGADVGTLRQARRLLAEVERR